MKKFFTVAVLVVALFMSAQPVKVHGFALSPEAVFAGSVFAEALELIQARYIGSEADILDLLEVALRAVADELDEYSIYLDYEEFNWLLDDMSGRDVGIGVLVMHNEPNFWHSEPDFVIVEVFPGSPAYEAGLNAGDIITAIDRRSVTGIALEQLVGRIQGEEGEPVQITVSRDGRRLTFTVTRRLVDFPTVESERLEDLPEEFLEAVGFSADELANYRYLAIFRMGETTADLLYQELSRFREEGATGIILDLRGNGGGHMEATLDIAAQLVPRGPVLTTTNRAGSKQIFSSLLDEVPFARIVVLVDRQTASAAEVIASALQDSGIGIVVGEETYGKGLVQTIYPMRTGGALRLTTEEYLRRRGDAIHNVGVVPCVVVEQSRDADYDEVLAKGIEILVQ